MVRIIKRYIINVSLSLIFIGVYTFIYTIIYPISSVVSSEIFLFSIGACAAIITGFTLNKVFLGIISGYIFMFIIFFICLVIFPSMYYGESIRYYLTDEDEGIVWSAFLFITNSITFIPTYFIIWVLKKENIFKNIKKLIIKKSKR